MKRLLIILAAFLVLAGAAVGGFFVWATSARDSRLGQTHEVHAFEVPVPFPLSDAEREALTADMTAGPADIQKIAQDRALARGKHLFEARYPCGECHGDNLGGGVMVDDPMVGRFLGPNITRGKGSVVLTYSLSDWERLIRHGVSKKGTATVMPSHDFVAMSDQELSDLLVYIMAQPPVDNQVDPVEYGPLGTVLIALGEIPLTAEDYASRTEHAARPPAADDSLAFGRHLAQVCAGCHGPEFKGGAIKGGAPDWPAASDLTGSGRFKDWTYEDFARLMRQGIDPNGIATRIPMTFTLEMNQKMTDVELKALFTYLKSLSNDEAPSS